MKKKIYKYLKKIIKILTLIGSIYAGIWVLLDSIGIESSLKHAIISGIFAIILSFSFMSIKYFLGERKSKYFIQSEDLAKLEKLLRKTKELKIFSSGSGSYRIKLNMILKNMKSPQLRKIKILIRDDNTEQRNDNIKNQIRQWEKDISKKYTINIEYYRYSFSEISLRGYIFDDKYALLGWYYNDGHDRYGNDQILVLYSSEYDDQKGIVEFANQAFDSISLNQKFSEFNSK